MFSWARSGLNSCLQIFGHRLERIADQSLVQILDYPVVPDSRWGYGLAPNKAIQTSLEIGRAQYVAELTAARAVRPVLAEIPLEKSEHPHQPYWNNPWFSCLDAAMLVAFLMQRKPERYVEIGSGFSTRFANVAVKKAGLQTTITSIDPHPRAEIDALCHSVIRQPLEKVDPGFWSTIKAGDIVFFDGSHRVFTNSDVVVFFLEVLPQLQPGVIVQIHDIHLPDDYPPIYRDRFYSEQYMLGVLLMHPQPMLRPLLPIYFVCQDPRLKALAKEVLGQDRPFTYPGLDMPVPGVSFWGVVEQTTRK